jgi:DNA-binding transcriptional LysR family regulator
MLDVRRLEVLKTVIDEGSFSAAAERLSFTQPAISRQIAALEREAGARLLERDARGVRPTQAGELLLEHATGILSRVASAQAQLDALKQVDRGRLRLGGFASANVFLIPRAITRFTAAYPNVELTLTPGPTKENLPALAEGDVDLALITDLDRRDDDDPGGLEFEHLLDDEVYLALPADHRLATRPKRAVPLRDLEQETWIEGAHPDCLGPLERIVRLGGFEPRVGFRVDEWTGKQGLVAAGVGVMLIPSLALSGMREDIALRRISPALPPRAVYAAYPSKGYRPPALDPMLQALRDAAADHLSAAADVLECCGIAEPVAAPVVAA